MILEITRMHSSMMRTVRSSRRLPGGGCLPGGVSTPVYAGIYLPGGVFPSVCWDMSVQGGVCPSACWDMSAPVHAGICLPGRGVSVLVHAEIHTLAVNRMTDRQVLKHYLAATMLRTVIRAKSVSDIKSIL